MIEANILARLGIGQMKMDVQAAAGAVGERFRHVRDDGSVLLGDLGAQHAEEGDSVGGDERVGVIEIDFVLPVRVLVIDLVRAPAELIEPPSSRLADSPSRRTSSDSRSTAS